MGSDGATDVDVDVVVVGAGFAGMYLLHKLREQDLTVRVIEAGGDVGGTWYWNRYPGARCDIESLEYSYSFDEDLQQEWRWKERYAPQPEILSYANHVADRFDLRRDITFDTRVTSARFDEDSGLWTVGLQGAETATVTARFVVMATGCLSSTNRPEFAGMDDFGGEIYHTGEWPHEGVDFTGKRVAVIGTGSSGIQAIPVIAAQCEELTVFQRTANYSLPAHNRPLSAELEAEIKGSYAEFRAANRLERAAFGSRIPRNSGSALAISAEEREAEYERLWQHGGFAMAGAFEDLGVDEDANRTAQEFVADKIAGIVADPGTAALLTPDQVFACKRMCVDSGYFETYNQPHVHLVNVNEAPIERFTESGIQAGEAVYEADVIVLATGFDAMTGTLLRIDIQGRGGLPLADQWSAGPLTYLGLTVPEFPNLFLVTGPGSPSVLTNMIMAIEQHVEWIAACIAHLDAEGIRHIEAKEPAAHDWVAHVNAVAESTLFTTCNSWYLGVNVPGKPRVYMPLMGFPNYAERCEQIAAGGYQEFTLTPTPT